MNRVAAIDCGTNSIRLLVADGSAVGLSDVHREMRVVRLGEGVDETGRLAREPAIERTRLALVDYAAAIAELGATRVRMVATSASRDAANAGDFTAMVRHTLGVAAGGDHRPGRGGAVLRRRGRRGCPGWPIRCWWPTSAAVPPSWCWARRSPLRSGPGRRSASPPPRTR